MERKYVFEKTGKAVQYNDDLYSIYIADIKPNGIIYIPKEARDHNIYVIVSRGYNADYIPPKPLTEAEIIEKRFVDRTRRERYHRNPTGNGFAEYKHTLKTGFKS
jgi:hypothetical protein